eukprot:g69320.t1
MNKGLPHYLGEPLLSPEYDDGRAKAARRRNMALKWTCGCLLLASVLTWIIVAATITYPEITFAEEIFPIEIIETHVSLFPPKLKAKVMVNLQVNNDNPIGVTIYQGQAKLWYMALDGSGPVPPNNVPHAELNLENLPLTIKGRDRSVLSALLRTNHTSHPVTMIVKVLTDCISYCNEYDGTIESCLAQTIPGAEKYGVDSPCEYKGFNNELGWCVPRLMARLELVDVTASTPWTFHRRFKVPDSSVVIPLSLCGLPDNVVPRKSRSNNVLRISRPDTLEDVPDAPGLGTALEKW